MNGDLLTGLGIGFGALAFVAAGVLIWRAVDQSVFAPGTGPAYQPWRADLGADPPLSLVNAALLAANAHNTQPWSFAVTADRVELFADRRRSLGTLDPLEREMLVSLGCALENLVLAAKAHGLAPEVTLVPTRADPDHLASVAVTPSTPEPSPLFDAIPDRHTDRAPFDTTRSVPQSHLDEMTALADDGPVSLAWLTDRAAMDRFASLTLDATRAIIGDEDQARDDFAWYRQNWHEIVRARDGLTMDAVGLDEPARILIRMLPASSRKRMQGGWLSTTRDRHLATAAAYGLVLARERRTAEQLLLAGRLFQRIHLFATTQGLAIQPLNQLLERADREATTGVGTTFTAGMEELTPPGWQMVMAFRIGYPTRSPGLSPRRAVEDVVSG